MESEVSNISARYAPAFKVRPMVTTQRTGTALLPKTMYTMIMRSTIVGIPIGMQCFKLASLSFTPFGREVIYEGGAFSFIVNVLWFLLSGLLLALENFLLGCLLCLTIVGIPFGKQFFKIAKLALAPFGAVVV